MEASKRFLFRVRFLYFAVPTVSNLDLYPVTSYLFLFALEYGKAVNARKPFWERGRKVTPSFP